MFSKRKLNIRECAQLEDIVADISYTCSASIDDLLLPDTLKSVGLRNHDCSDPIEKVYYSAYKDDLMCIHCGTSNNLTLPTCTSSDIFFHAVLTIPH